MFGRVVNFAMPVTLGRLIGVLEGNEGSPWAYIFTYVGLRFLQGSGGLSALQDVRTYIEDISSYQPHY